MFGLNYKEFSVLDCLPPNRSKIIVDLFDTVSGKHEVVSSYFEDGVFWEDAGSKACGIERWAKDGKGKFLYNSKVTMWAKQL